MSRRLTLLGLLTDATFSNEPGKGICLPLQRFGGGRGLIHQRSSLPGDIIHLVDRLTHLADAVTLLRRRRGDLVEWNPDVKGSSEVIVKQIDAMTHFLVGTGQRHTGSPNISAR